MPSDDVVTGSMVAGTTEGTGTQHKIDFMRCRGGNEKDQVLLKAVLQSLNSLV